ncbi:MAG: ABC transporter permease, partial [Cyclobacteriaceae bacterium]|nr:ABC transporter permease [Cyclobacteriaceae bacterium]
SSMSSSKSPLRKVLVTFQFVVSSILILSTFVIYKQFTFMKDKELGFDKELILNTYIGTEEKENSRKLDLINNRFIGVPEIKNTTVSTTIPFNGSQGSNVSWEGALPDEKITARYNFIGYDFFKTLGIEIVTGRNFSKDFPSDVEEACVINETAVRSFGWEDPLGKKVEFWDKEYYVIGVVKDFHPYSVFQKIPSFIFLPHSENIDQGMQHTVRIAGGSNILEIRQKVNSVYKEFFPNTLFDFQFLGDDVDDTTMVIYNGIVKTFLFFSMITILIAAVGMFGLVAFTTKSRTKEIGIRKIHGASVRQIFILLAREFVVLIIIAVVLSCPTGLAFKSIDPAAYKAETGIWEYLLTGGLVFLITFFTISYHTRKASKQNPVEALRYE